MDPLQNQGLTSVSYIPEWEDVVECCPGGT